MRKGFIFSQDNCVGCNACSAGCMLENGWDIHPRTVFTYNNEAQSTLAVFHLSMACNHCENPSCLEGCPSGALQRDFGTGAVFIDEFKCLGCNYCTWNCPYNAIKPHFKNGIVGKCNLCNSLLKEGGSPACTSACPTGALSYGTLHDTKSFITSVFADTKLKPALEITGIREQIPVKIIPERAWVTEKTEKFENEGKLKGKWSLIIFTFLTTLAVSIVSSSLMEGKFPQMVLLFSVIFLSGLSSLFHLGKPMRAWRALSNVRHSPLSREIIIFLIFCITAASAILLNNNSLLIISSITGLVLLVAVDSVYSFSDNRKNQFFHSGQTFLTGLLMISYFSGMAVSFMFIGAIKIVLTILRFFNNRKLDWFLPLRFFNIIVLLLLMIDNFTGQSNFDPVLVFLLVMGEFSGRIIYYIDFNPVNIQEVIKNYYKNRI